MPIGNGGIIGPANVPTLTTASGVWSLREQQQAQGRGAWPLALTPDPYFEYTTLLLPGNGTNGANNNTFLDSGTANSGSGFTITRNGNTTQGTFSPFSQTGWGNYFNGTNAQLSAANNAAFAPGSGDFTAECWIYSSSATAGGSLIMGHITSGGAANTNWAIYKDLPSAGNIGFYASDGTTYQISGIGGGSVNDSRWHHIAVSRSGSSFKVFVDGAQVGSTGTWAGTIASGAYPFKIGYNGSSDYFNGYISNIRVVKSQALYTGAFTPATSALTVSTVGSTGAGVPTQTITGTVSLLSCQSNRFVDNGNGNSGSGFTITVTGSPSVVAFSPFNPTLPWSAATNGGSGYFDGSGDYLQTPNNAAFNLSSGSFTIEAWVYRTNPTTSDYVFWSGTATGSNSGLNFYISGGNLLYIDNGVTGTTGYGSVTGNQWIHVALIRDGGNSYLYVNGVCANPSTPVTQAIGTGGIGLIGCAGVTTQGNFDGYISNFRIIKGQALVTGGANFTPPTGPVNATQVGWNGSTTALTGTCSILLNLTNAGIYDATSKNDLETVGNAQISTAISAKWGSGSMYFDGTGDYLQLPSQVYLSLPSSFTVECWAYFNSLASVNGIWFNGTLASDVNRIQGEARTTGEIRLYIDSSSATVILLDTPTGVVTTGQWYHLAFTVSGGTARIFVNGTQQASGSTVGTLPVVTTLFVGASRSSGAIQYMNGYLQDFRVTRGYARYVTGTGANAGKMVFNGTNDLALPTTAFPTF